MTPPIDITSSAVFYEMTALSSPGIFLARSELLAPLALRIESVRRMALRVPAISSARERERAGALFRLAYTRWIPSIAMWSVARLEDHDEDTGKIRRAARRLLNDPSRATCKALGDAADKLSWRKVPRERFSGYVASEIADACHDVSTAASEARHVGESAAVARLADGLSDTMVLARMPDYHAEYAALMHTVVGDVVELIERELCDQDTRRTRR